MIVDDEFVAGSYRVYLFEILDHAQNPIDLLTAKNIEFTLRPYGEFDNYSVVCKNFQNGVEITSSKYKNNVAQIVLNTVDTIDLSEGKYVYQLTLLDGNGKVFIPQEGHIIIKQKIKVSTT